MLQFCAWAVAAKCGGPGGKEVGKPKGENVTFKRECAEMCFQVHCVGQRSLPWP